MVYTLPTILYSLTFEAGMFFTIENIQLIFFQVLLKLKVSALNFMVSLVEVIDDVLLQLSIFFFEKSFYFFYFLYFFLAFLC